MIWGRLGDFPFRPTRRLNTTMHDIVAQSGFRRYSKCQPSVCHFRRSIRQSLNYLSSHLAFWRNPSLRLTNSDHTRYAFRPERDFPQGQERLKTKEAPIYKVPKITKLAGFLLASELPLIKTDAGETTQSIGLRSCGFSLRSSVGEH
jgi:hypothetical protein